ncbi:putative nepenthesin [Lupinus albus]|uniref:Putative nepenthesin n=1 Tax=Lupinus albus TaxID=3870 RepID=A0A6A4P7M5_LUPAL|nr:putative nepenthesin [Lupinus albus]
MASIRMMPISFVLLSLSLTYSSYTSPIGLMLKLIPPYSTKSPLFIPNLTFEERMQMLVQQSDVRVQHVYNILSSTFHANLSEYSLKQDMIPTPVIKKKGITSMVVEVGIGTFDNGAYRSYLLIMDTGSNDIWVQCEDCQSQPNGHCYPQKEDYFPNTKSKSYMPFNPPSPYTLIYGDGRNSSDFFAKETFTFPSSSSSSQHIKLPNIIFGCGTNNHYPLAKDKSNLIAGIFGLGMGKRSFINQIERQSGGNFSYCLVNMDIQNPPPVYLRFGTNIKPPQAQKP